MRLNQLIERQDNSKAEIDKISFTSQEVDMESKKKSIYIYKSQIRSALNDIPSIASSKTEQKWHSPTKPKSSLPKNLTPNQPNEQSDISSKERLKDFCDTHIKFPEEAMKPNFKVHKSQSHGQLEL